MADQRDSLIRPQITPDTSAQEISALVQRHLPSAACAVMDIFPRASLQIVGATGLSDPAIRAFHRAAQCLDTLSWNVLQTHQPATEVIGPSHPLRDLNIDALSVTPLQSHQLTGYPQVLWIARPARTRISTAAATNPPFPPTTAEAWLETAASLGSQIASARAAALTTPATTRHSPNVLILNLDRPHTLDLDPSIDRDSLLQEAISSNTPDGLNSPARWIGVRTLHGLLRPARLRRLTVGNTRLAVLAFQPKAADWHRLAHQQTPSDPEMQRMLDAVAFISQHFLRSPSLQEVAKHVHVSPYHFHRRFTELLGITPKHLLLEFQVHMAKDLLTDGTESLRQVASLAGFAHQSHFTSRFKQATGLTPLKWKRLTATR